MRDETDRGSERGDTYHRTGAGLDNHDRHASILSDCNLGGPLSGTGEMATSAPATAMSLEPDVGNKGGTSEDDLTSATGTDEIGQDPLRLVQENTKVPHQPKSAPTPLRSALKQPKRYDGGSMTSEVAPGAARTSSATGDPQLDAAKTRDSSRAVVLFDVGEPASESGSAFVEKVKQAKAKEREEIQRSALSCVSEMSPMLIVDCGVRRSLDTTTSLGTNTLMSFVRPRVTRTCDLLHPQRPSLPPVTAVTVNHNTRNAAEEQR